MGKRRPDEAAVDQHVSGGLNDFAQRRAENIARNHAKMQALGLLNLPSATSLRASEPPPAPAHVKRRKLTQAEVSYNTDKVDVLVAYESPHILATMQDCAATRVSSRLKGAAPAVDLQQVYCTPSLHSDARCC